MTTKAAPGLVPVTDEQASETARVACLLAGHIVSDYTLELGRRAGRGELTYDEAVSLAVAAVDSGETSPLWPR